MHTYTIPQRMSGTGSIHDISSTLYDREIVFRGNEQYAVVLAAYYGGSGRGYTTHRTEAAAIRQALLRSMDDYSYEIIDRDGNRYIVVPGDPDRLEMI